MDYIHRLLGGLLAACLMLIAFASLTTPASAATVLLTTQVVSPFVPAVPGVAAIPEVRKQTGKSGSFSPDPRGWPLGICQTAPADSAYKRPGGFCDYQRNLASLSDQVVGSELVSPFVPGTPGSPAIPAQCKRTYLSIPGGLSSTTSAC